MFKRLCWCRKLISYVCDSFTFKVCFKELGFYYLYEKISASNNVILKMLDGRECVNITNVNMCGSLVRNLI